MKKKQEYDVYHYKCPDCGFDGNVEVHGYIGRCRCGSYDVEVTDEN